MKKKDQDKLKKSALIIATLNAFITPFMGSSINIALPAISEDLHVDAVLLSWIVTSYLLAVCVCLELNFNTIQSGIQLCQIFLRDKAVMFDE